MGQLQTAVLMITTMFAAGLISFVMSVFQLGLLAFIPSMIWFLWAQGRLAKNRRTRKNPSSHNRLE
jgi:hypothetical protein